MNGKIYMRTSPSGRRYIGQTKRKEEERWKEHVQAAYSSDPKTRELPLSRSIRKYGGDSFTVEILETNIKTQDELDKREQYWINEYHTLIYENKKGLNATVGGKGNRKYINIDFQSLYDKGCSIGEISEITGIPTWSVSSYVEGDYREKCSRARKRTLKLKPPKSVSGYDPETREKVITFASTAEAAFFYVGKRKGSFIARAINGNACSAFGLLWKYDNQPMSALDEKYEHYHNPNNKNTRGLAVVCVETSEVFSSVSKAAKRYNTNNYQIKACCEGKKESAAGYHWRYEGQKAPKYVEKLRKSVVCVETGTVYPSVSEASRSTGIYLNAITDCLKGRRENAGGFHWQYNDLDQALLVKKSNAHFKPVVCVETGAVYNSIKDAAFAAGVDILTLRHYIKGKSSPANGFHWKYLNDEAKSDSNGRGKPVVCVETGVVYPSVTQAAELSGNCYTVINHCLQKRQETAGGYHWEYYKETA